MIYRANSHCFMNYQNSNISITDEGVTRKRIALFGGKENVVVNFNCTISSIGDSVTAKRLNDALISKFKKFGNSGVDESSDIFDSLDDLIDESESKSESEVPRNSDEVSVEQKRPALCVTRKNRRVGVRHLPHCKNQSRMNRLDRSLTRGIIH